MILLKKFPKFYSCLNFISKKKFHKKEELDKDFIVDPYNVVNKCKNSLIQIYGDFFSWKGY